ALAQPAAELLPLRIADQHEVRAHPLEQVERLAVRRLDDLEPVLPQVALEKAACRLLGLGEKKCIRHATDASAARTSPPDVLWRECVAKNRQRALTAAGLLARALAAPQLHARAADRHREVEVLGLAGDEHAYDLPLSVHRRPA